MGFSGGVYTRTNGVYSGASVWQNDRDAGVNITAPRHDAADNDIASALSMCLLKDGSQTVTQDVPFANHKLTGVATGTARTDAAVVGQLQDGSVTSGGTSGGAGNAYTITLAPVITAYTAGMRVTFVADKSNTGTATLAVNGLTATTIYKKDGSTILWYNDIQSGMVVDVVYDTAGGGKWQLINPRSENATAAITAAGSTQGTAAVLTAPRCRVSGADGTKGVILPTPGLTTVLYLYNNSASDLKIYPHSGGVIEGLAANAPTSIIGTELATCIAISANNWVVY